MTNTGALPERGCGSAFDLRRHICLPAGNVKHDGHVVVAGNANGFNDAEADNVAAVAGKLDGLQNFADVIFSECFQFG